MKLKAFAKLTIISIMKNLPRLLLTFSIFPVLLGLIMGYFQKDQFTPSVDSPIINIRIVDEDNSNQSKNLIDFLNSEEMKKLVEIDEEDAKYELIIPKGYEDSLLGYSRTNIKINVKKKGTIRRGEVLGDIIDRYNEEISQGLYIEKSIDRMDISQEEKKNIIKVVSEKIVEIYNAPLIETSLFTVKKSLTSYEHLSIIFLSYMLIMVVMSMVSGGEPDKEEAIYNRIMATPITKYQYFNYNLLTSYILVLFMNLLYVFAYRFLGLSFSGSLPILILIVLIQSIMITVLSSFISVFFKRKLANALLSILMVMQLLVGAIYPTIENDKFQIFKDIAMKYSPDVLITGAYRNYIIYNDLTSIKFNLLLILLVSAGLYLVSLLKLKWGEKNEVSKA